MADLVQMALGAGIGGVIALVLKGRKGAIAEVVGSAENIKAQGDAATKAAHGLLESTALRDAIDCRIDHKLRTTEMIFTERLEALRRDVNDLRKVQRDGQKEVLSTLSRLFDKVENIGVRTAIVRERVSQSDDDETEFS